MELNISEFESDDFDDFDINEMNELAYSVNQLQNSCQFENPMNAPKTVQPALNNKVIAVNKVTAVNNMFQQSTVCQPPSKMQTKGQSYPTSCEVKRQLIKEHMQQQQPQKQPQRQQSQQVQQQQRQQSQQVQQPQQPQKQQYREAVNVPITNQVEKSAVTYDDILSRLNVKIVNGQMQFIRSQNNQNYVTTKQPPPQSQYADKVRNQMEPSNTDPKANYIYNKYFNNHKKTESEPVILRPKTIEEYKEMVRKHIIERQISINRIRQIKSKKLIMPNSNIHISNPNGQRHPANLNKLFGLMK